MDADDMAAMMSSADQEAADPNATPTDRPSPPPSTSPPPASEVPAAEECSNPEEVKEATGEEREGKEEQPPPEDPSACVDTIQPTPPPPEGPGAVDSQEDSKEPESPIVTRRKARGRAGNNTGQGESGSRNPEGPR